MNIELILQDNNHRHFFVGANASGKTHTLKRIYENIEEEALFFDEQGHFKTLKTKPNIVIQNDLYIYINEKERGNKRFESEHEEINKASQILINKIKEIQLKVSQQRKSAGIEKISNILELLLEKNLNPIKNIIFDEPENFLDETNLKYMVDLLKVFSDNDVKTFIATHSSRFLELSSAKIEEIFVCSIKHENQNVSREISNYAINDIKKVYNMSHSDIKNEVLGKEVTKDDNKIFSKISFSSDGKVLDLYLRTILESQDFYQTLFYKKVILVEGLTEKLILQKIPLRDLDYLNFYFSNGKVHIPFYIELFKLFKLQVVTMFDSDQPDDHTKTNFPYRLTSYLQNKYTKDDKVRLVVSEQKDLENDYNIKAIHDEFSMESSIAKCKLTQSFFKPYIALFGFESNKDKYDKLVIKIRGDIIDQSSKYDFT